MKIGDICKLTRSVVLMPVEKRTRSSHYPGELAWRWTGNRYDHRFDEGVLCMVVDIYDLPNKYNNMIVLFGDHGYYNCSGADLELVVPTSIIIQ